MVPPLSSLTRTGPASALFRNEMRWPVTNVALRSVNIYLTPEQHNKAKRRAVQESERVSAQVGRPITISMADYIRNLIEHDPETKPEPKETT